MKKTVKPASKPAVRSALTNAHPALANNAYSDIALCFVFVHSSYWLKDGLPVAARHTLSKIQQFSDREPMQQPPIMRRSDWSFIQAQIALMAKREVA